MNMAKRRMKRADLRQEGKKNVRDMKKEEVEKRSGDSKKDRVIR